MTSYLDVMFTNNVPSHSADLQALEKDIGAIPEGLHEFLIATNGGVPNRTIYVSSDGRESEVCEFNSTVQIRERYAFFVRTRKLIPSPWIPIASDSGGNVYAVNQEGAVPIFLMDVGEVEREFICNSISEWIAGLIFVEDAF